MMSRGKALLWGALVQALFAEGCRQNEEPTAPPPPSASLSAAATGDEDQSPDDPKEGSAAEQSASDPTPAPAPRLPPGVLPGIAASLDVPGDRPIRVIHAGASQRRALVYLHGMCGNPEAMDDWSPIASHYGTMVVLRADVPCGDRPGFKWPSDTSAIQRRIDSALGVVAEQRGGLLDATRLVLIGYSQGAHRGERLSAAYPDRYPHLILGGPPDVASPEHLSRAEGVAILGGERENTEHMRAGAAQLQAAGIRSKFFLLPRVGHGGYGPKAPEVLGEVFAWLLD